MKITKYNNINCKTSTVSLDEALSHWTRIDTDAGEVADVRKTLVSGYGQVDSPTGSCTFYRA